MSKVMVFPPGCFSPLAVHDRWIFLSNTLKEKFGFTHQKTDVVDDRDLHIAPLSNDVDTVFLLTTPRFCNSDAFIDTINRNRRVKLISYIIDMNYCKYGRRFEALLERSDLILTMVNAKFRREWSQFVDKLVFWPAFFHPDERYTKFTFNENPIMKCLSTGMTHKLAYPLRTTILHEAGGRAREMIKVLPYLGTFGAKGIVTGDEFAKLLHSYFCGITTTTAYECVISKTLEIPAVGSLLLMNRIEDLDTMGFVPFEHYVPITQENFVEEIAKCLAAPEEYREIRLNGMKLVRARHRFSNRIKQLGEGI